MEFEDILKQVGEYGRYQKRLIYFFLIPSTTIFAILCMNTFFMLSEPDHWCFVPEIANLSHSDQQLLSRPFLSSQENRNDSQTNVTSAESNTARDSCTYYDIDYESEVERLLVYRSKSNGSSQGFHPASSPSTATLKCDQWVYDDTHYDSNAVSHLNLVCDKKSWKSFIQTIHGVGEVVGNPFFGTLSDMFGRHTIFFLTLSSALLSSTSPIILRGLLLFTFCRFLNSFTAASLLNLPYIIITELVGPEHRTKLIGLSATCWTIGMCLVPGVAYLSRDWVTLTVIPTLLVLLMFGYWSFLPESPRWYLSKGKYKEAYRVMANIARVNGKPVPTDLMQQLVALNQHKEKTRRTSSVRRPSVIVNDANNSLEINQDGSLADIFRNSGLRNKFFILTFAWTANVCAYRGLTLNFENFHGNEFLNWLLLSVVEFPSNFIAWFLMDTCLGRRWTNSMFMTAGGLALCVPLLVPDSADRAIIIASMVAKFLTNTAYNVTIQQTVELFPTPVRNQALSYMTAFAAGANFALPYLAVQGKVHVWIPLIVMGVICIVSGITNSFLPETLYENLPQTIEDGDSFGRKKRFFSLAKKKNTTTTTTDDLKMPPLSSPSSQEENGTVAAVVAVSAPEITGDSAVNQ